MSYADSYGGAGFYTGSQQAGSQASPSSEARTRSNTLRPVTIKQVLEATQELSDGPHKIDGFEISHITFVARVRSVAEQPTNITYVLDDGTGTLDVKQWVDADSATEDGSAQQLNGQYVRVLGQLKVFNNKRHVSSHKIRPVQDYNEVQYHLLEATAVHLHLTRGPPAQFAPAGETTGAVGHGRARGGSDVVMGGMGAASNLPDGVSHAAKVIYSVIKSASESSEGIHLNVIKMRSKMSEGAVDAAVEELVAAGCAYTTLDEYHFALMDF